MTAAPNRHPADICNTGCCLLGRSDEKTSGEVNLMIAVN